MPKSDISNNPLIVVEHPTPYQYIGAKFDISGWVSLSLFETVWGGLDWRMFVDYVGLDAKNFMGTAPEPYLDDTNMNGENVHFSLPCELHYLNTTFIKNSHGRITLKIGGPNEKIEPVYLPLIVKEFGTAETANPEILERHSKVGDIITQYEQDLKNYYKEFNEIEVIRKAKNDNKDPQYLHGQNVDIASGIQGILNNSDESFDEYAYSNEDKREQEIEEKYKDALEWRGPLAYGIVSKFVGFELRVYSDDHDNHFHVIHKGKGINARFSFPELQLINYKMSFNTISSKQEKDIREFCLRPEIFAKFEQEFGKRPTKI